MYKKIGAFIFVFLILTTFLTSTVAAQSTFESFLDGVVENLNIIAKYVLGDVENSQGGGSSSSEIFFIKVLTFIVLLAILVNTVKNVPTLGDNQTLSWIISLIVAIIAVRALTTSALINFLWTPTGVLGVTMITILPFILFFFFIESFNTPVLRKIGWGTFAIIYFLMGMLRWEELKLDYTKFLGTSDPILGVPIQTLANLGWVYMIIGVFSILMIIYDSYIRGKYISNQIKKAIADPAEKIEIAHLENELKEVTSLLRNADKVTAKALLKRKKDIIERIETIVGH